MRDLLDIFRCYGGLVRDGRKAVLATLVAVSGSAYRRPGARMLIADDGSTAGAVSGGCVENDIVSQSLSLLASGLTHSLLEYDTTRDDEILFGTGSGCPGKHQVFLQVLPASAPERNPLVLLDRCFRQQSTQHALITSFCTGESHLSPVPVSEECTADQFVEEIEPRMHLLIFGAGKDVKPLAAQAGLLGWLTTVIDPRMRASLLADTAAGPSLANAGMLEPGTTHCKILQDGVSANGFLKTAAVIMSHTYIPDRDALATLLQSDAFYIGVLGPARRTVAMLSDIRSMHPGLPEQSFMRVYGPTGIDIGAEGSHEIAVSIVSEIIAASNRRAGGSLRHRTGPIHSYQTGPSSKIEPGFSQTELVRTHTEQAEEPAQCSLQQVNDQSDCKLRPAFAAPDAHNNEVKQWAAQTPLS